MRREPYGGRQLVGCENTVCVTSTPMHSLRDGVGVGIRNYAKPRCAPNRSDGSSQRLNSPTLEVTS